LWVSPAHAQSASNSAAAQALFDSAKTLMSKGRYAEACPKFEESQRIDPGAGTLLNLAVCYERQGRTSSAWTTYLEAGTAARAAGNAERARMAKERAAALAPRLARLTIEVNHTRESGLEVQRDGSPVGSAQWGSPIPTDPGSHVVSVTAPGRKPWRTTVTLREAANETTVVPELEVAPVPEVAKASQLPKAEPGKAPTVAPRDANGSSPGSAQRALALAAVAVGGAGVVVGSIFGFRSMSARNDAQEFCDGAACHDDRGVELTAKAVRNGNASTVAFVVGAVGLAGGAVLWFTAPRASTQVGVGPGTLQIGGTW
jgi:serine/threonine-protein kinase